MLIMSKTKVGVRYSYLGKASGFREKCEGKIA